MSRRFAFWYYFAFFLLLMMAFILADFSHVSASVRLILLILAGLVLVLPGIFSLFNNQRPSAAPPVATLPITPDQAVELSLLKNINKELEGKLNELKTKEGELGQANQRLQELDKAKSQFVSMTTHQLRTPLAAIKWTFHMILNGEMGPVTEDQKHFLQKGYDSAERVITVINDWLNIDYIEANKDEYKFIPVNVNEMIDGVVFEFTGKVNEKKINLVVNRPKSNIPPVELDPIKISMVLENLIDNALKYTPEGGHVTISILDDKITSAEKTLEISVADSGIGIPVAEQARIFSRFFRSSNAVKVAAHGSGLGLFIGKDIVEKHGGKIWFESREGEGTTFHIAVPIKHTGV